MIDLAEYERRGDLEAAFVLTKHHKRDQERAESIRRAVRCDLPQLTWEAYAAGAPCPGCGLPYVDAERFEFRGTMNMTAEERLKYDAEEARFTEHHRDCHAIRHSVSGSLTNHCGRCCPAPPISPARLASIGQLFGEPKPPHELMRWRLRLFCGHVVQRQAHFTHKTIHSAFTGSARCPECGLDPAAIVDGQAIGLAAEPPSTTKAQARPLPSPSPKRTTKTALEARVRELEAEVERLRGGAGSGRSR